MNSAKPVIRITDLHKVFRSRPGQGQGQVRALQGINLEIYEGEFICILGPSGCGKSTLLDVIAGFSFPSAGSVVTHDRPVLDPGPDRAMVFQEYALFP